MAKPYFSHWDEDSGSKKIVNLPETLIRKWLIEYVNAARSMSVGWMAVARASRGPNRTAVFENLSRTVIFDLRTTGNFRQRTCRTANCEQSSRRTEAVRVLPGIERSSVRARGACRLAPSPATPDWTIGPIDSTLATDCLRCCPVILVSLHSCAVIAL